MRFFRCPREKQQPGIEKERRNGKLSHIPIILAVIPYPLEILPCAISKYQSSANGWLKVARCWKPVWFKPSIDATSHMFEPPREQHHGFSKLYLFVYREEKKKEKKGKKKSGCMCLWPGKFNFQTEQKKEKKFFYLMLGIMQASVKMSSALDACRVGTFLKIFTHSFFSLPSPFLPPLFLPKGYIMITIIINMHACLVSEPINLSCLVENLSPKGGILT